MHRIGSILCAVLIPILCGKAEAGADRCALLAAVEATPPRTEDIPGARCDTFLNLSGETGVSCAWEFGYRSELADRKAEALWSLISSCRDGQAAAGDQPVNHPDSYALREWLSGDDSYRVSIKDKGGQSRTLVFLRYR